MELVIEGKVVRVPDPPLYYVKSFGTVVWMGVNHAESHSEFERCVGPERELWRLDVKGRWHLLREMFSGRDSMKREA